jgi:hypothetical protein
MVRSGRPARASGLRSLHPRVHRPTRATGRRARPPQRRPRPRRPGDRHLEHGVRPRHTPRRHDDGRPSEPGPDAGCTHDDSADRGWRWRHPTCRVRSGREPRAVAGRDADGGRLADPREPGSNGHPGTWERRAHVEHARHRRGARAGPAVRRPDGRADCGCNREPADRPAEPDRREAEPVPHADSVGRSFGRALGYAGAEPASDRPARRAADDRADAGPDDALGEPSGAAVVPGARKRRRSREDGASRLATVPAGLGRLAPREPRSPGADGEGSGEGPRARECEGRVRAAAAGPGPGARSGPPAPPITQDPRDPLSVSAGEG